MKGLRIRITLPELLAAHARLENTFESVADLIAQYNAGWLGSEALAAQSLRLRNGGAV